MGVEPAINGANVILARQALEKLVGADVVTRAFAALPHETVEAYTTVTSVGWVPVRVVDAITHAVSKTSGWAPQRLSQESARLGVESLMNGLWRVMLRFTSDAALVSRTPMLYSKTYNVGRLESVIPRPGLADVTQSGWPEIPDLQLVGLAAGIETVLRCAGRKGVQTAWRRTSSGASFTATWSP